MIDVWLTVLIVDAIAFGAIALLALAAYRLRATTLVAPLCWAIITIGVWLVPVLPTWSPPQGDLEFLHDEPTMFKLAALSSFCPALAVLGARRPQNIAWQFIVFSFLAIGAMGILPQLLNGDRDTPPHIVWQSFYAVLIVVGWINHLPTRLGLAATILALGQLILLQDCLPIPSMRQLFGGWGEMLGAFAIPAAAIVAVLSSKRWTNRSRQIGWNRVWRDFRNLYGVVWGLRVMERVNALAESSATPVRLDWRGFQQVTIGNEASGETPAGHRPASDIGPLEPGLRNLLRRFVSNDWIDVRLESASRSPIE